MVNKNGTRSDKVDILQPDLRQLSRKLGLLGVLCVLPMLVVGEDVKQVVGHETAGLRVDGRDLVDLLVVSAQDQLGLALGEVGEGRVVDGAVGREGAVVEREDSLGNKVSFKLKDS